MDRIDSQPTRKIAALAEVAGGYAAIFCDIWGVVHNGERKHPAAEEALVAARSGGARVVLLTNSPRPAAAVMEQLDGFGVTREAYDAVVTSGDATRALIAESGGPVFHIGPERDLDLFAGLDVERTGSPDAARAAVATGLYHDEKETPDDYRDLLADLKARDLSMICANPDIVVHRGERLIYCAGALARDYAAAGGKVELAGKPHAPIYRQAMRVGDIAQDTGILAIGDGLMTDVKGANDFGCDVLLIIHGIHGAEFGAAPAEEVVARVLAEKGLAARYFMAALA
ncbi:TIGR01459 family HAD-type hydrolase [Aurantimonas sp. VKM B-3413]|uniref:TIGR01459 family HAD-type hydrolase n=1 Tax=Aurantimonas sp. VKM B-3413 TaxID=2779401 RepID=UPI001E2B2DEA|nr:TIGR01459 family HAD-type hydrolase [Aurantimonas sp. VKM B-3413]MCB8836970.1 TIGR01459 family HAD-type hydrolase [Aurantimonas sp. VKM B-3413]